MNNKIKNEKLEEVNGGFYLENGRVTQRAVLENNEIVNDLYACECCTIANNLDINSPACPQARVDDVWDVNDPMAPVLKSPRVAKSNTVARTVSELKNTTIKDFVK